MYGDGQAVGADLDGRETMEDATLLRLLEGMGEMKAELAALGTMQAANFRSLQAEVEGVKNEFRRLNGSVGDLKDWRGRHEAVHVEDKHEADVAEAYDEGAERAKKHALTLVERAGKVITHPLVLGMCGLILGGLGWLWGARL